MSRHLQLRFTLVAVDRNNQSAAERVFLAVANAPPYASRSPSVLLDVVMDLGITPVPLRKTDKKRRKRRISADRNHTHALAKFLVQYTIAYVLVDPQDDTARPKKNFE